MTGNVKLTVEQQTALKAKQIDVAWSELHRLRPEVRVTPPARAKNRKRLYDAGLLTPSLMPHRLERLVEFDNGEWHVTSPIAGKGVRHVF